VFGSCIALAFAVALTPVATIVVRRVGLGTPRREPAHY
jgi:hypothetical protein